MSVRAGELTKVSTYAQVSDVESLSRARTLGVGNTPTPADVIVFLELSTAEINSVLLNKGYELPIAEEAVNAHAWLRGLNAKGALVQLEKASPTAPNVERVEKEYNTQLDLLRSAEFSLDAPYAHERTRPRGPGLTVPEATSLESVPFFRRNLNW